MDAIEFLGVQRSDDPRRWSLPVTADTTGGAGQLFGGCAVAAAVTMLEELTGKPAAWATAQFLSNAFPPEVLQLDATVSVQGYNFVQAQVVGRVGDRQVIVVLAALGTKRFDGAGTWRTMPEVPPPDRCTRRLSFGPEPGGLSERIDQRIAVGSWGDETSAPTGVTRVWMRMADQLIGTTTGLAIAADFLPLGLRASLGRDLFGTSLDNTLRFARRAATDWVLADLQIDELGDGVGHGSVALWSAAGELLAVASQSCAMRELSR